MIHRVALSALLLSCSAALAQTASSGPALQAPTTIPIVFTRTISADHSKVGDTVSAKTTQQVELPNGASLPKGARVSGHIASAVGFTYDKTPYARQKASVLTVHFDSVQIRGTAVPLDVTVRAMADPITSREALQPQASDIDSSGTTTQIGGDQLTPFEKEVRNADGDVVAYNKRGGVYAHLIASGRCDGSDTEVSVGIYSASACGQYGFVGTAATEFGSSSTPSTLTLVSSHGSPKVWSGSTALLEVLSTQQNVAAR
ncbi:hypothetical protein [Silvibacterium acidisoli]|uniref:hypothetical protein n=1 Tax=Acidobacteriaceae bacterium ZG23-2 TaxID=2883246 RepID=UPI00406CDF72